MGEVATAYAPRQNGKTEGRVTPASTNAEPEHIPTSEHPNPSWHAVLSTIKDAEDNDLMKVMGYLINTKLDCIKMFEGRDRFMLHDIQNVYMAMPYFIDIEKLARRK